MATAPLAPLQTASPGSKRPCSAAPPDQRNLAWGTLCQTCIGVIGLPGYGRILGCVGLALAPAGRVTRPWRRAGRGGRRGGSHVDERAAMGSDRLWRLRAETMFPLRMTADPPEVRAGKASVLFDDPHDDRVPVVIGRRHAGCSGRGSLGIFRGRNDSTGRNADGDAQSEVLCLRRHERGHPVNVLQRHRVDFTNDGASWCTCRRIPRMRRSRRWWKSGCAPVTLRMRARDPRMHPGRDPDSQLLITREHTGVRHCRPRRAARCPDANYRRPTAAVPMPGVPDRYTEPSWSPVEVPRAIHLWSCANCARARHTRRTR
jgi:hypothetical protein